MLGHAEHDGAPLTTHTDELDRNSASSNEPEHRRPRDTKESLLNKVTPAPSDVIQVYASPKCATPGARPAHYSSPE